MTNEMIILTNSIRLMETGVLKGSGRYGTMETDLGPVEIEFPEAIHTFQRWKELGYSVKKGEKSSIKFPIWKHTVKMLDTNTDNAELNKANAMVNEQGGQTNMFMKTAAFFTFAQVEPIKAKV